MVISFIKQKLGINRAIFFSSITSITGVLGSLISVIFVLKNLTQIEQGFYYTFSSLIAIQIFFELGLNNIITQFIAHEFAHLKLNDELVLEGSLYHKSRLASILKLSIKIFTSLSLLLFILLIFIGYFFFSKQNNEINWIGPWLILSISVTLNFIISPLISFLQGIGEISRVAKIKFFQQIAIIFSTIFFYISGFKLYVLGISNFIGVFIIYCFLLKKNNLKLFNNVFKIILIEKVDYLSEIFPLQWKIAISWISGYFIFQLFNPILFTTKGPIIAGQMGLTLAALNGIQSISSTWITTKIPDFSEYIALKDYKKLDYEFNKTLKQTIIIIIVLLIFLFTLIYISDMYNLKINEKSFSKRFIDYIPLLFMSLTFFINQIVGAWGTYLRAHKKEPFLYTSIIGAILVTFVSIYSIKIFDLIGMTIGYFIVSLCIMPFTFYIYNNKKKIWHNTI